MKLILENYDEINKYLSYLENNKNTIHNFDIPDIYENSISLLDISRRIENCLKCENIFYIGSLIQWNYQELLKIPNFGKKSIQETKEALSKLGLSLNTTLNFYFPTGKNRILDHSGIRELEDSIKKQKDINLNDK